MIRYWPAGLSVPLFAAEAGAYPGGTGARTAFLTLRVWRFSVRFETPWRAA